MNGNCFLPKRCHSHECKKAPYLVSLLKYTGMRKSHSYTVSPATDEWKYYEGKFISMMSITMKGINGIQNLWLWEAYQLNKYSNQQRDCQRADTFVVAKKTIIRKSEDACG